MSKLKSPIILFLVTVIIISLLALFGPEEQSLGSNVRIVYLHGAWVLSAELAFLAAGLAGLIGLVSKKACFTTGQPRWDGQAFSFGLPISHYRCGQWNPTGMDFSYAEPRFRLAVIFAVTGLLLQLGLWLINTNWITSLANLIYIVVLRVIFATADNMMHPPPSPIFNSGNYAIIGFFLAMILLSLVAAYFLTRFFLILKTE